MRLPISFVWALGLLSAQTPNAVVFENVRIFRGSGDSLTAPSHVLVTGNKIARISASPIPDPPGAAVTRVAGAGKTLMPGLINAHSHLMFASVSQLTMMTADVGLVHIAAAKTAEATLMQGFTSARDVGGPIFGLKQAIDAGIAPGPRIWPSGASISQTGGHGDFRIPTEVPAPPGSFSYAERMGATALADSPDAIRMRSREQLMRGASQLKVMAGGGAASIFDPLDVTQYTAPELRAAVEAAENWGTYVTVHAYTPRAVRQSIEAGVKCIDHGHLLDEDTVKLMAAKGVWWSLQPFVDERKSGFEEGSPNRIKQLQVMKGTERAYALAKKYRVKTAWGTDTLFNAEAARQEGEKLIWTSRFVTPAEVLTMATSANGELLALSGLRSPYEGKLGVVEEGALADLLLVNGDPIADLKLFTDPAKNLLVIMKDGRVYKNLVK
jgi:imidazolonepropionase-like amidohydrolase